MFNGLSSPSNGYELLKMQSGEANTTQLSAVSTASVSNVTNCCATVLNCHSKTSACVAVTSGYALLKAI